MKKTVTATPTITDWDNPLAEFEALYRPGQAASVQQTQVPAVPLDPTPLPAAAVVEDPPAADPPAVEGFTWKRKQPPAKRTITACIVIDNQDVWHDRTLVDLNGVDAAAFSWGYYGTNYPVLVEDDLGQLKPFYLTDMVGENSTRLYKASHPEGFRNAFKHRSTTLQKIQVGLMVALVLGLFFLMFVMISQ